MAKGRGAPKEFESESGDEEGEDGGDPEEDSAEENPPKDTLVENT